MTRNTRRIIAGLFILAFLITAPLIILYASGYRYNRKRGTIQGTGAITISTKPKGATVTINGIVQNNLTPFRITQLSPTTYHIKIEKQGYTSWETTAAVEPWENKLYSSVRLFSLASPIALPSSCTYHSVLFHNPSSPWTLLSSSSTDPFILFNANNETCVFLDTKGALIATAEDLTGNSFVMLTQSRQTVLTIVTSSLIGKDNIKSFPLKRTATHVAHLNDRDAWVWDSASVSRVLNLGSQYLNAKLNIIDILPMQNGLYTLETDPTGSVALRLRDNDDPNVYRTLSNLALSTETQFINHSPTNTLTLFDNRNSRVVLIDLTDTSLPPLEFSFITRAAWSQNSESLILSNDHEISLYLYDKKKNAQRAILLTRISDTLRSVLFIPEIGYVAYTTPTHLSFISINPEIDAYPHTPFPLPESDILGFSSDTLYLASQNKIFKYDLP
ncbi:MAG: PEGA domain-containing protein [Patescibacteria group bacterium]